MINFLTLRNKWLAEMSTNGNICVEKIQTNNCFGDSKAPSSGQYFKLPELSIAIISVILTIALTTVI